MKKLISLALAFLLAFSCFALAGSAFWGGAMPEFNPGTYNATDYSTKFVESKCVYKGSDGSTSTSTYSYDDAGNLVKSTYTSGEAGSTTTYAYDSNGNVTKRVFKNASGAYSETETFTYTSKGLLSKQTYKTTENGSTNTGTFTHTYNSKGLLTKRAYSVSGGDYTYSYNYSYDADGNVSKIVLKSSDSPSRTTTYTYNSKPQQQNILMTQTAIAQKPSAPVRTSMRHTQTPALMMQTAMLLRIRQSQALARPIRQRGAMIPKAA